MTSLKTGRATNDHVHWRSSQQYIDAPFTSLQDGDLKSIYIKNTLIHTHQLINTLRPRQNGRHFAEDFFECKFYEFGSRFHWSLLLRVRLTLFQHWFRLWLGAGQATSHYLNQWLLVYWRIYASIGLNGLILWIIILVRYGSILFFCHLLNDCAMNSIIWCVFGWTKKLKCDVVNCKILVTTCLQQQYYRILFLARWTVGNLYKRFKILIGNNYLQAKTICFQNVFRGLISYIMSV